ncbi:MAG TPA: glycoside hydrolase family 38 C-terminal domain-containing protein, partial [Myxococcota bacterium]
IAVLADAARPDEVKPSSLTAFANDITARAKSATLAEVRGELRDSYGWMWTLQGTLATRAHQKRRNAQLERLLVRDVEPWAAFAARRGTASRNPLVHAAWRSLLLCHPHDTICGCSTDEVGRAMDARLDEAGTQALGIRGDALCDVIGHKREDARVLRDECKPAVIVRNPAPRARGGVAILKLTSFLEDVKVGIHADAPPAPPAPPVARTTPSIADASAVQVLERWEEDELTESPRHYPDDDRVAATRVAAWLPEIPAYGVRGFKQVKRSKKSDIPNPVRLEGTSITNGCISVSVDTAGRVSFADIEHKRHVADLLSWESVVDLGDLYTPSPRGAKLVPFFTSAKVLHRGPVRGAIEMKWAFRAGSERVTARVQLIVDADARVLRIHVRGENAAVDHRLRLRIATDVPAPAVFADAMFGPVERKTLVIPKSEVKMEFPLRTAPLHRYVSLFGAQLGATVYSDGLAEYEADDHGGVFVTLLRACGELSRIDLPERPGNAGWPTKTPEAQCKGPFAAELALMLHDARTSRTIDEIERAADDVLVPLTGGTLRSALRIPQTVSGAELRGEGLACATIKESDHDEWTVLRCVNLTEEQRAGSWRLGFPVTEAWSARLDETLL